MLKSVSTGSGAAPGADTSIEVTIGIAADELTIIQQEERSANIPPFKPTFPPRYRCTTLTLAGVDPHVVKPHSADSYLTARKMTEDPSHQ